MRIGRQPPAPRSRWEPGVLIGIGSRVGMVVAGMSAALGLVTVTLAGCGDGSTVVRPPTSMSPTVPDDRSMPATQDPSAEPSESPRESTSTATITVRPVGALRDGQRVRVTGTGFTPGEALQVIQCADKGQQTGPGDCNLAGMLATTADAEGRVDVSVVVKRGPFGTNGIVCSARLTCLVSVTQASLSPSEEADAPISFARSTLAGPSPRAGQ